MVAATHRLEAVDRQAATPMAVQAVMPQLTKTTVDRRVTKEWLTIRGDDRLTRDRDRGNGRTASRDNDDRDNGHRDHRRGSVTSTSFLISWKAPAPIVSSAAAQAGIEAHWET